jgi:fimbrial chaperone protein
MKLTDKTLIRSTIASTIFLLTAIDIPALSFGISPIKVYFQRGTSSRDVTLDNPDDKTVRLKVNVYKWEEDATGKRKLTPTKDITLFPSILELKPKSKRIIRLASKLPPGQAEQSYRLLIEQIPETVVKKPEPNPDGTKPTKSTVQLNFLYTLDLPVFINPININRKSTIISPSANGGKVSFNLANQGNAHIFASIIEITTKDAAGKEIAKTKFNPTYVLPTIQRQISIDLPQEKCQNAKSISIDVAGDEDMGDRTKLNQTINVANGVCTSKK